MSELDELNCVSTNKSPTKLTTTGKILIGISGGVAIGLSLICAPFVSPALRKFCLPYIPATDVQIKNVLTALGKREGKLLDLGSGDGRIVFEVATRHPQIIGHGVELNPWLVLYSRIDAFKRGKSVSSRTNFFRKNLWKYGISDYDNIVIFGVEQMMADLEKKFIAECKSDCKIIACRFPLPNLKPIRTVGEGVDTVWLYEMSK
ncbi:PREDICTED: protein FAM173B [Nicrophorus vespilloides]|uniref:Protein FAM173B n=1 Tax=Nicrophorus vespilloides TaxID=110193 RepID=A0ABM1N3I3_NICVS|nr:PREDICTED: protein FAM173B [Nicrophorus vespilloides]